MGRGTQYATQLALILILPKVLAPDAYLKFNLVLPLAFLGVSLVFGWLASSIFRHVHELLRPDDSQFRETVFFYYGLAGLVLIGMYFAASFYSASIYRLVPLILVAAAFKGAVLSVLNASEKYRYFFYSNVGFAVALFIFLLMCWKGSDDDLAKFMSVYAGMDMVLAVVAMGLIGIFKLPPLPRFNREVAVRYLNYGFPLVMSNVAVWVVALSDRYFLALWEVPDQVADYILSYQLASSLITIPMAFVMAVVFPKVIRMDKESGEVAALQYVYRLLGIYLRYMIGIVIAGCVIVIPFKYYFYSEYAFNPVIIVIIVLAHVVFGLSHFYNKEFELNGKTFVVTRGIGLGAALNVFLNLVLIPIWGGVGAAIATLAAYSVFVLFVRRARSCLFTAT